jgi:hypothetical protein
METRHSIEVPLPHGVEATMEDLELLETALKAIVDLRFPGSRAWEQIENTLVDDGWTVNARIAWVAEARRGHETEKAVGRTRDEAFEQLQQLTRMDDVAGVV